MTRRHKKLVTAGLVLMAGVAAGCSEGSKKPVAKAEESKPSMPMPSKPVVTDGEGFAASTPAPVAPGPVTFADGESAYNARNYAMATEIFTRYTEQHPKNAWGHFMLGLSSWKSGNLIRAELGFNEALRLDPGHRGAHEYIGEAYLTVGNLPKAKEHLSSLDKLCFFPCSEFSSLKKAVADYEAKSK